MGADRLGRRPEEGQPHRQQAAADLAARLAAGQRGEFVGGVMTRMTDPDRAGRLWAARARARATLRLVEVGGLAESEPRPETVLPFRPAAGPQGHRLFRVELSLILSGRVVVGRFAPESWPQITAIPRLTERQFDSPSTYP